MEQNSGQGKQELDLLLWDHRLRARTCCAEYTIDLLHDLLHQCPILSATLERLPLRSLSALLVTSRGVRHHISAALQHVYMVRSISVTSPGFIFVRGK